MKDSVLGLFIRLLQYGGQDPRLLLFLLVFFYGILDPRKLIWEPKNGSLEIIGANLCPCPRRKGGRPAETKEAQVHGSNMAMVSESYHTLLLYVYITYCYV